MWCLLFVVCCLSCGVFDRCLVLAGRWLLWVVVVAFVVCKLRALSVVRCLLFVVCSPLCVKCCLLCVCLPMLLIAVGVVVDVVCCCR